MSLGYWIVKGDKTTCGGTVLEGNFGSTFDDDIKNEN